VSSLSDLCTTYISSNKLKDDTEKNIIEFCEAPWGLGLGIGEVPPLYPTQKFIFKCIYNIPLLDKGKDIIVRDKFNEKELYRFTETEYLTYLYEEGHVNVKEITGNSDDYRQDVLLVIGRRGTKTSTIATMVSFETYKLLKKFSPQEYYKMMPDDEIRITCIATNQEQASELFRRISGNIERSDYFRKYRNKPTLSYMQLSTQRDLEKYDGSRPSIRIVASPCSGRGLRGHNNIIAVLDEMAYFFESDTSDDKSDKTIYEAVTPSTIKFVSSTGEIHGRTICISSPGPRSGLFWELYQESMKADNKDITMIQAPTWEIDHTISSKVLRAKYSRNPLSYMAEYGAQFSDRISAWIENEQILRVNIVPGLKTKNMSYERIPHFMGIDIGLKTDGSALAICHIVRKEMHGIIRNMIELDHIAVRYAKDEDKEYFHPEDIAEWIASYNDKFFITKGIMDQYYGMSILPVLENKGMKQIEIAHMSRDYNSRIYQNLMSKMLDASLIIPEDKERLVDNKKTKDLDLVLEMLKLKATSHSKYLITVEAPEGQDFHDDLSDAYARAVYTASEYLTLSGSSGKMNMAGAGESAPSFRKYYMKQKRNSLYTNRPSSSLQMEMSRGRHFGYGR